MTSLNDTKNTITRKIKIGKIWYMVFLSIQPIADLSCEFEKKKIENPWSMQDQNPFFFQKWSILHERSGIGWIERKSDFPNFRIILMITWKIKFGKFVISFVSAHCTSFMRVGSKLRGGVVCISFVGTEPKILRKGKKNSLNINLVEKIFENVFWQIYFYFIKIYSYQNCSRKKIGKIKFRKNVFFPLIPPVCGGRRFWIESPLPTGYWVSLVGVFESGSQKSLMSQFSTHFEYKIDDISKSKNQRIDF